MRRKNYVPWYAVLLLMAASCSQAPNKIDKAAIRDSVSLLLKPGVDTIVNEMPEEQESETASYYIVEVAAGYNFDSLKSISTSTAALLGVKFDMLEREYKVQKGIIVPDSSADEMYRGEYYPRRPIGNESIVSIEMADSYRNEATDTLQMIVMAGMYAEKRNADSVATLLRKKYPSTKTYISELFLGCMH